MVQAPGSSSPTQVVDVDQVLRADREHLIHPLYHPTDHTRPLVIVRGEGCYLEPDLQFGRGYLEATLRALQAPAI